MSVINLAPISTAVAQGTYPRRGGARLTGTCIVHTSEGNWRNGVDNLTRVIQIRADYGSYHRGVDWEDIVVYYDWEWEAWQDSETNNWAVGISAACKTSDWGTPDFVANGVEEGYYRNLARCAADFVVYMASAKGIHVPLRRISGAQARAGVPGFCAHGDSGVSRSDPGANFNWGRFFQYIQDELNGTVPVKEEDDMFSDQDREFLHEVRHRVMGRDEQRWIDPNDVFNVSGKRQDGWYPARSTDVADVISTNRLIQESNREILAAIRAIPNIDTALVDQLGEKLEARIDEATRDLTVTLSVPPADKA